MLKTFQLKLLTPLLFRCNGVVYFSNKFNKSNIKLTPVAEDEWLKSKTPTLEEVTDGIRLSRYNRRHDAQFYVGLIEKAYNSGDREKIVSIFFHDMIIRDWFMPTRFIVHEVLRKLYMLGGSSEAALRVFKKAMDIGIQPNSTTYNLLFKNFAFEITNTEIKYQRYGNNINLLNEEEMIKLQAPAVEAYRIWNVLRENKHDLELPAVNSLLRTLGNAHMLKELFIVLDQHLSDKKPINEDTLICCLETCYINEKNGLGLALIIFKMLFASRKKKFPLTQRTFSVLLKIVRKCKFGTENEILVLKAISNMDSNTTTFLETLNSILLGDKKIEKTEEISQFTSDLNLTKLLGSTEVEDNTINVPVYKDIDIGDFLTSDSDRGKFCRLVSPINLFRKDFGEVSNIISVVSKLKMDQRLVLLGGVFGFLKVMHSYNVEPNIYVFTSLLDVLPLPQNQDEDDYLKLVNKIMEYYDVDPDRTFNNFVLLRKNRSSNKSLSNKTMMNPEILDLENADPYTWSAAAAACVDRADVQNFITLANECGVVLSADILMTVLRSCKSWPGKLEVLKEMDRYLDKPLESQGNCKLSRADLAEIELMINNFRAKISRKEKEGVDISGGRYRFFHAFQKKYSQWIDKQQVPSVTVGDRIINVDDIPSEFVPRDAK